MNIVFLIIPTTLVLLFGAVVGNTGTLEPQCTQLDYNNQLLYKMIKVEEEVKQFRVVIKGVKKLKEELKDEHMARLAATEDAIKALNATTGAAIDEIKKHNGEQQTELRASLAAELEQFMKASETMIEKINEERRKLWTDTDEAIHAMQSTSQKSTNKPAVGFTVKGIKELSSSSPTHATFTTVVSNIGDGYDTVTGLFTCPVQGTYFFSASLLKKYGHTRDSYCQIYRKSSPLVLAHTNPKHAGQVPMVNSAYVHLEVGDTVKLAGCTSISSTMDYTYSSFTGFLVTPDVA